MRAYVLTVAIFFALWGISTLRSMKSSPYVTDYFIGRLRLRAAACFGAFLWGLVLLLT